MTAVAIEPISLLFLVDLLSCRGGRHFRDVAQMASHIAVMRAGQFAEFGPAKIILEHPESGYTKELLAAVPEVPRTT